MYQWKENISLECNIAIWELNVLYDASAPEFSLLNSSSFSHLVSIKMHSFYLVGRLHCCFLVNQVSLKKLSFFTWIDCSRTQKKFVENDETSTIQFWSIDGKEFYFFNAAASKLSFLGKMGRKFWTTLCNMNWKRSAIRLQNFVVGLWKQ